MHARLHARAHTHTCMGTQVAYGVAVTEQLQQTAAGVPQPEGSSVLLPPTAITAPGVSAPISVGATGALCGVHLTKVPGAQAGRCALWGALDKSARCAGTQVRFVGCT